MKTLFVWFYFLLHAFLYTHENIIFWFYLLLHVFLYSHENSIFKILFIIACFFVLCRVLSLADLEHFFSWILGHIVPPILNLLKFDILVSKEHTATFFYEISLWRIHTMSLESLRMQWRLIFAIIIGCYKLRLWVGYFIYSEFTHVFF